MENIKPEDLLPLIEQGIHGAGGTVDASLLHLTANDLIELGRTLAARTNEQMRHIRNPRKEDFYNELVRPITSLKNALGNGRYNLVADEIKDNLSTFYFAHASSPKQIYFVPVLENLQPGEEETYMNRFGLTLCKSAPNYLAGAMMQYPETSFPMSLDGKDIVAFNIEGSSVFVYEAEPVVLYVARKNASRKLRTRRLQFPWLAEQNWVFLGEVLEPVV